MRPARQVSRSWSRLYSLSHRRFCCPGAASAAALRIKLVGAGARNSVQGMQELPGRNSYFTGNDPAKWRVNIPTYAAVEYHDVYPGINLLYHGDQRLLEYDFRVAPGADPHVIDIHFEGARKLSVNRNGALVISLAGGKVIQHAPVVYQEIGERRETVAASYVLRGADRVGFRVAEYDRSKPLVIDPVLVYSTYLGGTGEELGTGIAVSRRRRAPSRALRNAPHTSSAS